MKTTIDGLLDLYEEQIFGQRNILKLLLTAVLADGHVLLEGVPGTGKTKMVKTLAKLMGGDYRRVQFTPDLLPSDITGSVIFNMKDGNFEMIKGPVFTNILLADEINRTPAKTQAALLEAMEEKQVTIYGETHVLPDPFFVVATQNPLEFEGTYPLPEAQQDRFMFKLLIDYPNLEAEKSVIRQFLKEKETGEWELTDSSLSDIQTIKQQVLDVTIEEAILDYILQIVRKTRESDMIRLGSSSRGALAMAHATRAWAYLHGRDFVTPDDVKMIARPALRHRIIPSPHMELEGGTSDQIIQDVVGSIPVPR